MAFRVVDGVASTKLKRADYAGSTLYGWLSSAASAKVRAMLAYKRIPFTDHEPSIAQLDANVRPNVGRVCLPVVKLEQAAEEHCGKDTSVRSPFAKGQKRSHSLWWRQNSAIPRSKSNDAAGACSAPRGVAARAPWR